MHTQNEWKKKQQFNILVAPNNKVILEKCRVSGYTFSNYCEFSVGVQAYDSYSGQSPELIKKRPFHSDLQIDESFVKELNGKDVTRYNYLWPGNTWISYGNWLAHPRQLKFFFGERILVREIIGIGRYSINACYVEEYLVNYKSILNIILTEDSKDAGYNTKYFLGILNSTLISWIFKMSSNKIVTQTFPRISILDIKQLPLIEIDFKIEKTLILHNQIVYLVDFILSLKQTDCYADTGAPDKEIDQIVYELYNLTDEEIRIVEKT
jgi:hypothetical protein